MASLYKMLGVLCVKGDDKKVAEALIAATALCQTLALRRASRVANRAGDFATMAAIKTYIDKNLRTADVDDEDDDTEADTGAKLSLVVKHGAKVKPEIWAMVKTLAERLGGRLVNETKEQSIWHLAQTEKTEKKVDNFCAKIKNAPIEGLTAEKMVVTEK
jgi:hypothetical protein